MAKGKSWPFLILLGLLACSVAEALLDDASLRAAQEDLGQQHQQEIPFSPPLRSQVVTRISEDAGDYVDYHTPTSIPTTTPTPTYPSHRAMTVTAESCPATTTVNVHHRRDDMYLEGILATISSLQLALASATAGALSLSQEFAYSLDELKSSTEYLASSASDALLVAEASASSALAAVEASAAQALADARESAASSISEAVALAPSATRASNRTYQAQTHNDKTKAAVSPTIVGVAIAAAVVGTILLSLLAFCLFMRRRKAKQRAQEEENEVNAALDRAIVSYIVKELPSPQGSANSNLRSPLGPGALTATNSRVSGDRRPSAPMPLKSPRSHLEVPESPLESPRRPPEPPIPRRSGEPPRPSVETARTRPSIEPLEILEPPDSPRLSQTLLPAKAYQRPSLIHKRSAPTMRMRPPPLGHNRSASDASNMSMLPVSYHRSTVSSSSNLLRAFHRRTASSHFMDSAERVYGDILTSPLETTSPPVIDRPPSEVQARPPPLPPERPKRPREDVGWPLTKQPWV
ncbi:hypothetical protein QBC35DRAFT_98375 [Podospora australis]|uniref:Transmembrane protein n=1 Tax=Podospora australis TaxID=1536484 RepID=A0AAN6WLG4_9PEZI|nr:hypothetical protein QBC35DRAFT_98375 [Podospora australis]